MENSFSAYRNKSGVESDSDSEIIDNSLMIDDSLSRRTPKTPGKNKTVFVAESEESYSDDESEEDEYKNRQSVPKTMLRKSNILEPHVISSSDDDASKRGSLHRQSEMSFNNVVLSSSEDEDGEGSPEIVPKRRPPMRAKSTDSSSSPIIRHKKNKRILILDSDTDNSIVIEHEKYNKMACLKETPLKLDDGNTDNMRKAALNTSVMEHSFMDDEAEESDSDEDKTIDNVQTSEDDEDKTIDNVEVSVEEKEKTIDNEKRSDDAKEKTVDNEETSDDDKEKSIDNIETNYKSDGPSYEIQSSDEVDQTDDEGPDEDQMVMSRATRMSIMGIIPKDNDSDDSDFIESDEKSRGSSATDSLEHLPDVSAALIKTPAKLTESDKNSSRLTCSPFSSPLHDVTNTCKDVEPSNDDRNISQNVVIKSNNDLKKDYDDEVTFIGSEDLKDRILKNVRNMTPAFKENVIDDDVTIIDTKPEIIALSSDDEESSAKPPPKPKAGDGTLQQYLAPASYPNLVVYVQPHVLQNEKRKLEELRRRLREVKNVLATTQMASLPDGGALLEAQLASVERQLRAQGDKVGAMVAEPANPTPEDIARDGLEGPGKRAKSPAATPSWDELQRAGHAVQPRMYGKQAMATHLSERNLIMERLRDLHTSLDSSPSESTQADPPRALKATLMPHQLYALAWLRWRETQRPPGGILADDMGLGKTLTMIALILSDKEHTIQHDDDGYEDETARAAKAPPGGTLVVCPASLMQQWQGEVQKHCRPHAASVCLHHGAARATLPHRLATYDVVVTTYNLLQRDHEKKGVLTKVQWRRVILDEAHIVRNHKSATSLAVGSLPGRRRWALTGTPVQNKDLDLFALLKFLRCTPFDDLSMWKKWIDNKSIGGQERLSTIMRGLLLRRTKAALQQRGQLACLPKRTVHFHEVTLEKEEMNVYQKVLVFSKTLFAQFLHQRAERQADGAAAAGAGAGAGTAAYEKMHRRMVALQGATPVKSHEILVLLLRLRQVCCHCGLIAAMLDPADAESAGSVDEGGEDLLEELNKLSLEEGRDRRKSGQPKPEDEEEPAPQEGTSVAEAIRSVLSPANPVFRLERLSSKIRAVMACLESEVFVHKGERAVIVSQWTSVLSLVEKQLNARRIKCVTLSGAVPVPARPPLINAINDPNSGVRVMLLSLCAGGVGLNLAGASHLLLLDPHWNPQLEEQAQDRIYRVGQTRPVHIYRFMCVDTVEQTIRKLQLAKLELAEAVLTGARNTNASKLTIEDLKMLFNMGQ